MRELAWMVQGSQTSSRALVVAQAALVWALDGVDIVRFVTTGHMDTSTSEADVVLPYDPMIREMIVKNLQAQNG